MRKLRTVQQRGHGRGRRLQGERHVLPEGTSAASRGEYHFLYKHGTGASSAVDSYAAGSSVKPGYSYTSCTYVIERDPYGLDLPTLPELLEPTSAPR